MKKFNNYNEYETWVDGKDDCEDTPILIDDGWKVCADMFTECKSWKTALRRFAKVFKDVDGMNDWYEGIKECAENGFFKDSSWCDEREDIDQQLKEENSFGGYGWEIENVDDNEWYIFLNISGAYAGREYEEI